MVIPPLEGGGGGLLCDRSSYYLQTDRFSHTHLSLSLSISFFSLSLSHTSCPAECHYVSTGAQAEKKNIEIFLQSLTQAGGVKKIDFFLVFCKLQTKSDLFIIQLIFYFNEKSQLKALFTNLTQSLKSWLSLKKVIANYPLLCLFFLPFASTNNMLHMKGKEKTERPRFVEFFPLFLSANFLYGRVFGVAKILPLNIFVGKELCKIGAFCLQRPCCKPYNFEASLLQLLDRSQTKRRAEK